MVIIYYQHKVD